MGRGRPDRATGGGASARQMIPRKAECQTNGAEQGGATDPPRRRRGLPIGVRTDGGIAQTFPEGEGETVRPPRKFPTEATVMSIRPGPRDRSRMFLVNGKKPVAGKVGGEILSRGSSFRSA